VTLPRRLVQRAELRDLLDRERLERSSVVANCAMNRGRRLQGPNGYAREIGLCPLAFLLERASQKTRVAWLDLCCGEGRALLDAARTVEALGLEDRVRLVGVDLVDHFAGATARSAFLERVVASVHDLQPSCCFDLVTCVHGLHYVGDKLGALARAASWLEPDGLLVAHLDLANLRWEDGRALGRRALSALRREGFTYDTRRRLLARRGRREVVLPFVHLGSDDRAGPNYTGQPAVTAYYRAR
jgi:SAM-dependent methyltransferase